MNQHVSIMAGSIDSPGLAGARLSVLICETSRVQRRILREILEDGGFTVIEAGGSQEAFHLLRYSGCDIFITGIEVGQVNGLELCWRLKAEAETCHIHTIVMTALGQEVQVAEALDVGADDFIPKPFNPVEMKARIRAAARIVRLQRDLRGQAETDSLTGAANRRAFMQSLERAVFEADRQTQPLSLIMADLDHFKAINDTHGHATGDRVLVQCVSAMRSALASQEMLARLGGEEFGVIMPRCCREEAEQRAECLRRATESLVVENDAGDTVPVSASLGVTVLMPQEYMATPDELLSRADSALYRAKASGRNRIAFG
ncbi:GGDEF domain-containing response regulator [Marinicauda pacifica]|uniref:GGDEF domain-containing response regulator n=1 Tax=Marinicauda pacifica TaxID=1133559 RepID=UPI0035C82040